MQVKMLLSIVMVVTNSVSGATTQMASIYFKNQVIRDAQTWCLIDEQTRAMIKEAFMSLLGSSDDTHKIKASGICVAAVAIIENQRGQWLDFLELMSKLATSEPYEVKTRFAAMQTL